MNKNVVYSALGATGIAAAYFASRSTFIETSYNGTVEDPVGESNVLREYENLPSKIREVVDHLMKGGVGTSIKRELDIPSESPYHTRKEDLSLVVKRNGEYHRFDTGGRVHNPVLGKRSTNR